MLKLAEVSVGASIQRTWRACKTLDVRLLDQIAYLSTVHNRQSKRGGRYAVPGRRWLAQRLGCSVWTISRHTSALQRAGILQKYQRPQKAGRFRSCVYWLVEPGSWVVARTRQLLRAASHRVRFQAHRTRSESVEEREAARRSVLRAQARSLLSGVDPPGGAR